MICGEFINIFVKANYLYARKMTGYLSGGFAAVASVPPNGHWMNTYYFKGGFAVRVPI